MEKSTSNKVGNISSAHCFEALQSKENSILIDVRSPQEWEESGIADLSFINKEVILLTWMFFSPNIYQNKDFINQLEGLIKDKENTELFFICKSGGRSVQAANAALSCGYKNCYNVEDGFLGCSFDTDFNSLDGWVKNGLPRRAL